MKKFKQRFENRMNILKGFVFAIAMILTIGAFAETHGITHWGILGSVATVVAIVPVLTDTEKAMLAHVKKEVEETFDKSIEGNKAIAEMRAVIKALNEAKTVDEVSKLKGAVEEIGLKLQGLAEKAKEQTDTKKKSFADNIMTGVKDLWSKPENIAKLKSTNAKSILNVKMAYGTKAAETMTEGVSVVPIGTNSIPFSLTEFEPGLTRRVRRQPFIAQLINVSRTMMEFMAWAEQTTIDPGVAGNTAEGTIKTQGSFRITEKSQMIETMTYYIKISKRMLDDLSSIENEIRTELMDVLALRLDSQVLKGNGTSPQLKGILSYAQAFSATSSLAGTIVSASNYDAICAALLQVRADGATLNGEVYDIFNPTDIVLHPADAMAMELTKDSQGRYLMPPFMSQDGKMIQGLPIIENVGMTQGSYLVGDFSKSNLRIREDANIAFGYENEDFTKNLVTILGEMRAGHYIKDNHAKAFVSDTFVATKAIIQTV